MRPPRRLLTIVPLTCLLAEGRLAAEDRVPADEADVAPAITVSAGAGDPLYAPPPCHEGQAFLPGAALQKQISIAEALDLPGGFGDPMASVRQLPGVVTGPGGELFVLGAKDGESSTTINHLRVGYLFHVDGLHSVLSPEAIDQLDVGLGAFDTTYGNATGGVIDLTPRYPTEQRTGYVRAGLLDVGLGYEGGSGSWSAAIHARRSYADLILDPSALNSSDSRDRVTTFPNYEDVFATAVWRHGGHRLSFEAVYARDQVGVNLQENAVKDPAATGQVDINQGFLAQGVRWTYADGPLASETLIGLLRSWNRATLFGGYRYDIVATTPSLYHATTVRLGAHALTAGIDGQIERTPYKARIYTVKGEDAVDVDITTAQIHDIDQVLSLPTVAVFLQDQMDLRRDVTVRFGLRIEDTIYGSFSPQAMPRGALIYRLGDADRISLASGLYNRRPESYKLLRDSGNPHLHDEQAVHYAAEWTHRLGETGEFTAGPFLKTYRDLVVDSTTDNYRNAGTGRTAGANLSVKIRGEDWYLLASYAYQEGERQLTAEDPRRYSFYGDVTHAVQIAGSHRFDERWSASFLAKYSTGQPYTPIVGTYGFTDANGATRLRPRYGTPYSERFDDFFAINVKVGYDRALGSGCRLESALEVLNLTNHRNVTGIIYDDQYRKKSCVVANGLFPTLSATLRF